MKTSEELVVVEQDFDAPVNALWRALVDVDEMRRWFFPDIPNFKAEPDFYIEFMVDAGERKFLHQWRVTEVIPEQLVAYRWTYEGYPGSAISVFELSGDEQSSQLKASFPVEQDFPDEIPEFTREACLGGWVYFINQQLKQYLDG